MGNSHSTIGLMGSDDVVLEVISGCGKRPSTITNVATGEVVYTTVLEKPGLLKSNILHVHGGSHGQSQTPFASLHGTSTVQFHMDVGQAAADMQQRNFLFKVGGMFSGRNRFIARSETWRFARAGNSITLYPPSAVSPIAIFTYVPVGLRSPVKRSIRILQDGNVTSGSDKKSRYALYEYGKPTAYLDITIVAELLWRRWDAGWEGTDGMGGEILVVSG